MGHKKKEKLLFYIKVECWWKVSSLIPKIETKERGKLIRDILKRNTGKLIKTGGSISQKPKNRVKNLKRGKWSSYEIEAEKERKTE